MGFKEEMKVDSENEVLLIVEDRPKIKLKFFLESLQGTDEEKRFLEINTEDGEKKILEVKICGTSGEAEIFLWKNLHRVSIAILDCAFPREEGDPAEFWAALDLMRIIERGGNDIPIILNTGYDGLNYEDFLSQNVIYLSQNRMIWSERMKNRCSRDSALDGVLSLLRANNKQKHPNSKATERVVTSQINDKGIYH